MGEISLGVLGSTPAELLRRLAPELQAAGFRGLWLNAIPGSDPLPALAEVAEITSTLRLCVGVLPLDSRPIEVILSDLAALHLPRERVVVGVGAGGGRSLARVAEAVEALRSAGFGTAVGGLGPRMRSLGARSADSLLLNWLTPALAAEARAEAATAAAAEGRAPGRVALYIRTVMDPDALPLLQAEAGRYAAIPSYAANFARHAISPIDTTIADTGTGIANRLDLYLKSVDEVVLRAVTPHSSLEDYLRFVRHPDVVARLQAE